MVSVCFLPCLLYCAGGLESRLQDVRQLDSAVRQQWLGFNHLEGLLVSCTMDPIHTPCLLQQACLAHQLI